MYRISFLEKEVKEVANRASEADEKVKALLDKSLEPNCDHSSTKEVFETKIYKMQQHIKSLKGEMNRKDERIEEYRNAARKLVR
jgi:hypothetical protein